MICKILRTKNAFKSKDLKAFSFEGGLRGTIIEPICPGFRPNLPISKDHIVVYRKFEAVQSFFDQPIFNSS